MKANPIPTSDSPDDAACNPFNDPHNQILGVGCGTVLINEKHLDVVMQLPLPGIVIFVHGVNSDGEWFDQTEKGLCEGLNDRLKRQKEHLAIPTVAGGKLCPAQYGAELTSDGFINPDTDGAHFIKADEHFSPVLRFRWGYKASSEELQLFGSAIYLNEENYWGGGPFANGCTSLPDLWGSGLADGLFLWMNVQHMNPVNGRKVYSCPPRPYYVLAALRLAKLVESIRMKQADTPITIVCHSQGNMIGIAAAFLGDRLAPVTDAAGKTGRCVADNYVLCNPPYSLVKSNVTQGWAERDMKDAKGNGGRQTFDARVATMSAFFDIVRNQTAAEQPAEVIDQCMKNEAHGFAAMTDRNRHGYGAKLSTYGRVTLYFNPHDQVISSSTIQGIGWRGLSQSEIEATNGTGMFCQRVFAQNYDVGKAGTYDFWSDQHNKPARGSHDFWFPNSPKAHYSLKKGMESNGNWLGKVVTFATAPIMIAATGLAGIRINALPPNDWKTPLTAPDLPASFKPEAVRFGVASTDFDQGHDAPAEYRDKNRERTPDDPYAGDRKVPNYATTSEKAKGTDAAEGDAESEAALRYEHHAMLRMQAKREGLYENTAKVLEEDNPDVVGKKYTAWRTEKIKTSLADDIDTHATDHSTIMTNGMHAQKALAYDVAIGVCRIKPEDLRQLRVAADWRHLEHLSDGHLIKEYDEYFLTGKYLKLSCRDWVDQSNSSGRMPSKIFDKREIF